MEEADKKSTYNVILFIWNSRRCKLTYSAWKQSSDCLIVWGWEFGEGITKEDEESLEMMDMFIILIVAMVS